MENTREVGNRPKSTLPTKVEKPFWQAGNQVYFLKFLLLSISLLLEPDPHKMGHRYWIFWMNSWEIGVMYVGRQYTTSSLWRLFMPVLLIRYVYTGSRIRTFFPIPDPGSKRFRIQAFANMIRDVHPESGSWLFPYSGSRIQGSKRHRIRIRNTGLRLGVQNPPW